MLFQLRALDLLSVLCAAKNISDPVSKFLPRRPVQIIAELAIVVHLTPAIPTPLAASHVDEKIAIVGVIVELCVVLPARTGRERVDFALMQERRVRSYPRLAVIQVLEGVLLLVLPLHVALLVVHRVPPDVQHAIGPGRAAHEEGAEVEAAAVLRHEHVD